MTEGRARIVAEDADQRGDTLRQEFEDGLLPERIPLQAVITEPSSQSRHHRAVITEPSSQSRHHRAVIQSRHHRAIEGPSAVINGYQRHSE